MCRVIICVVEWVQNTFHFFSGQRGSFAAPSSFGFGGGANKDAFLVKNVPIPEGSTIELLSGNKIFLNTTDIIKIQSDTAASFNCVLSFVEQS